MKFWIAAFGALAVCLHASAQSLEKPDNTVAIEKQRGRVNCTAQPGSDVLQWSHSLGSQEFIIWKSNGDGTNDPNFEVEIDEDAGRYDLVFPHTNSSQGGTYHVELLDKGTRYDVEVVVLSGLNCHPSSEGRETIEGAEVVVVASTAVYGHMEPIMSWYSDNVLLHSYVSYDETNITKSAMSNLSATPELHGSEYHGVLLFEENEEGLTPPAYTDSCDTFYHILYRVQDLEIYPYAEESEDLLVLPGESLNCTAIGNPFPSFHWFCDEGSIIEGPVLTVAEGAPEKMYCICRGDNILNGQPYEASANVTFFTSGGNTLHPKYGSVWCIALTVLILKLLLQNQPYM